MNVRPLAVIWLALLLAAPPAVAQVPRRAGRDDLVPFGQQTHAFRAVLKEVGTNPLDRIEQLFDKPAGKVLVVLGETRGLDKVMEDVRNFVRDGGAVLIATDRPTSEEMYAELGVRVSGEHLLAPREYAYRGELAECPLVLEFNEAGGPARHPVFQGLAQGPSVATNRPSFLQMRDCVPLATLFQRGVELPVDIPLLGRFRFRDRALFGVTGPVLWKGKLLVLADHSLFINDMMLQPDNQNIDFAFNVARWLTDNGQRTDLLYIEDGILRTDFEVSLEYPPPRLPPAEVLLPLLNQMLIGLERENAFNRMALQAFGTTAAVMRTAALLLTLALLLFGLYRFLNSRHRAEPRVPKLPAQLALLAPPVPALELRHQAVLAQGNLSEAARELARQAFTTLGVPPAAGAGVPAFTVAGSWWQRLLWGRRVRQLWELAALGRGRRVSSAGLRRLSARLHELNAAVEGGKLHFMAAN